MELVTGHGGADHISAADLASMYRGLLVSENVVLASGDKLSCTMVDANTAEIGVGDCMVQAHHCRVETAEQIAIENGSPGYKRNDLIVIRYTLGDGNIQDVYLDVIKGTAVTGTPSDPTYTDGDIDGGDTLVEFPLWRIPIDGVNVGTPVRVMPTVDTLQEQITANAGAITSLRESVSSAGINTTILVSWGTYNTVNQSIALSGNISNFDMIIARFGSDTSGTAGGGAKLVWVPINGSIETSQFEVSYMLNGTHAYGTFKFPDNTHIMLIGVNGGLAMRQVYGVKFFN